MRKYKIGDQVIMEEKEHYSSNLKRTLKEHNYVFTIIGFFSDRYYDMKENNGAWQDCHITGIYDEKIDSRFEILDLWNIKKEIKF